MDTSREEAKPSQKQEYLCCNSDCNSKSSNFTIAPRSTVKYYQATNHGKRTQYVCEVCLKEYMTHTEKMVTWALEKKPLFLFKMPEQKETVLITDSDEEESEGNDEKIIEDVPLEIEDDLQEVIKGIIERIDLKSQYEGGEKILLDDMSDLKETMCSELEVMGELQNTIDSLRNELFNAFAPIIEDTGSIEIIDSNFMDDNSMESGRFGQRRSSFGSSMRSPNKLAPLTGVAMKKVTQVQRYTLDALASSELNNHSDIVALETRPLANPGFLPPPGPLQRPRPKVGEVVHVMKTNYFGVWSKAKILDVIERTTERYYRIKYENSYRKGQIMKVVTGRQMAYSTPCPTRIPVGTRVVAIFRDDENSGRTKPAGNMKESYYCGVVAECPKCNNNYRYLIFFDDGYAQYVRHEKILVVCESSDNVWEDIHPDSRDFIRKYLIAYPERPMVRLSKGHVLRTEWNGKWWVARVLEVDASLVHLHFDADGRTEWIYRGSTRLGPLYTEIANANARSQSIGNFNRSRCAGTASLKKLNLPYVEYTRGNEMEPEQVSTSGKDNESRKEQLGEEETEMRAKDGEGASTATQPVVRAVARKSTSIQKKYEERRAEYGVPCFEDKMIKYNKNLNIKIKTYVQHQCGPKCLEGYPYPQECTKGQNPLAKPLLCGWIRQIVRHRGGTKRVVLYVAPCGRRIRNLVELHSYLRMTKSTMPIDLFDFDFWVHCLAEFTVLKHLSYIKDISYGKEKVLIPAVNWIDYTYPRFVEYSTVRIPTPGVHLNLDPDFLVCCDCDDDCQDKEKCACWQLTIQGTRCSPSGQVDPSVGYMYKRLPEPVTTGIYECNSRCKCNDTCLNRVAQLPLQQRLQVFRTRDRGWGVQCLNDIPQGAFVCIYVGQLLTEQGANEDGKAYGDEYLAELDYIEVVERIKEGYESDVMEDVNCEDSTEAVNISTGEAKSLPSNPSYMKETSEAKDSEERVWSKFAFRSQRYTQAAQIYPPSTAKGLKDSEDEDYEDEDYADGMYGRYQKGHKNSYDVDEDFKTSLRLELTPSDLSIRSRLRKRKEKNDEAGSTKSDDSSTKRKKRKDVGRRDTSESQSESSNMSDDEDSEEVKRLPLKFTAAEPNVTDIKKSGKSKFRSIREIYGPGEYCYIMDAKNIGNVGRYLNHSCTPNVFVQNVFVDSHDLRFPWVAFFALTYITAGTELTWDYNYDVGSVPGKVMYCYCGSSDCRGRLL